MVLGLAVRVDDMRVSDVAAVHEVERHSFRTPWPAYAFEQELTANRLARYLVARAETADGGEKVVGFAGIWLMVDEAHVTTFGVHPEWRRRGVGRRLMLRLLEQAVELGANRMTLEVRVGNEAAKALYRGFGFNVAGRRPRYYTDDGEDAYVMTTPPLGSPPMQALLAQARERYGEEADR